MSLALRFGGLSVPSAYSGGIVAVALPRLPKLADFLPQMASKHIKNLQDLRNHLEGGTPPFMIDNGMILRAVPKKRPSHRRTREKLYAPGDKQIKNLENLGRCPACGHVKRSHFMCMRCFAEIRSFLKEKKRALLGESVAPQSNLDPVDEKIIYPGKYMRDYEHRLMKKDYIPQREEPLMYRHDQVKKSK